jgi:hypothetical protein
MQPSKRHQQAGTLMELPSFKESWNISSLQQEDDNINGDHQQDILVSGVRHQRLRDSEYLRFHLARLLQRREE